MANAEEIVHPLDFGVRRPGGALDWVKRRGIVAREKGCEHFAADDPKRCQVTALQKGLRFGTAIFGWFN